MKCRQIVDNKIVWFKKKEKTTTVTDVNNTVATRKSFSIPYVVTDDPINIKVLNATAIGYNAEVIITLLVNEEEAKRLIKRMPIDFDLDISDCTISSSDNVELTLRQPYSPEYAMGDSSISYTSVVYYDNYLDGQSGVASSVTQRLSVIKGELWYNVSYGLPLLGKVKSKAIIDASVIQIVNSHPDVNSIKDFNSNVVKHSYSCSMTIVTRWGDIALQI